MRRTARTIFAWLLGALLASSARPVQAYDYVRDDLGLWAPVTLTLPLDEEQKLSAWIQVEPRFDDNLNGVQQILFIPGLSHKVKEWMSVEGAVGYIPSYPDNEGLLWEFRMLQQATFNKKFGRLKTQLRARIEERWIEHAGGVSVRNRYRLLLEHPISLKRGQKDSPWYIVGYDEFFVNLNSTPSGPQAGYDQNRAYLGLGRYLGKKRQTQVDAGYQLVHANSNTEVTPDLFRHVILLRISSRLR